MFTLFILPENGSQLPDIHPFSDFADLVSDMPGKGKVFFFFYPITFTVKQRLFTLAEDAVTSGKTTRNYCGDFSYRITFLTLKYFVSDAFLCAGQTAGHLCQLPRVLFILHANVAKEGQPVSLLQSLHHSRKPMQRNHR